jgi:hypothetical protein
VDDGGSAADDVIREVEAAPSDGPLRLVIVLPPADGLAPTERARVRLLVEQVIAEQVPTAGLARAEIVEPADRASAVAAFERSLRRVGPGGTVCMLGAELRARLEPALALYPATQGCVVPHGAPDSTVLAGDVDLEQLGRTLGTAARAAAGSGTVLVLDGSDALLDARWRRGVAEGVVTASPVAQEVHVVRSASEASAILDDQAALLAEGVVPGSPVTDRGPASTPDGPFPGDGPPIGRVLPEVAVVVLDASPEAALLVRPLVERGIRIVAPTSVLASDPSGPVPDELVVLGWYVRWDVVLRGLITSMVTGEQPAVRPLETLLGLEPGGASVSP